MIDFECGQRFSTSQSWFSLVHVQNTIDHHHGAYASIQAFFGTVPGIDGIDQRQGTSSALKISPQGKACFVNINDTENRP